MILSQYVEPRYAMRLLEEHPGQADYLLKRTRLRRRGPDRRAPPPSRRRDDRRRLFGRERRADPFDELTMREREVLASAVSAAGRAEQDNLHAARLAFGTATTRA
jgi:hypothetical protein